MRHACFRFFIAALCGCVATANATSSYPPPTTIQVTAFLELNNEEQSFMFPVDSSVVVANWRDFRLGYRQIGVGRSVDGGETFASNYRITFSSMSPNYLKNSEPGQPLAWLDPDTVSGGILYPQTADSRAGLLGEHIAVSACYDKISAVWTDSRPGDAAIGHSRKRSVHIEQSADFCVAGIFGKLSPGDIAGELDLSDLFALVNFLFLGGASPADCL
ncbi:MAG: hypothetical protein RBT76_12315 [candidate division Zixibacteria bacterium]|jgi:hypothetical protein|nr:hypothetical protein [candidate division Zixibacteria bacterium]